MIYHLHVVKTAGTTVFVHLKNHVPGFRRIDIEEVKNGCILSGHEVRYGMHKAYKDPDPKYMMVLRDPAEWLLSMYNQDLSRSNKKISFEDWYESTGPNSVTPYRVRRNRLWEYVRKMLNVKTVDQAESILKTMWFVSVTECFDYDFGILCDYLCIPRGWEDYNVAGRSKDKDTGCTLHKHYTLPYEMRKKIYKENEDSTRIYEIAKRCRERMLLRGLQ